MNRISVLTLFPILSTLIAGEVTGSESSSGTDQAPVSLLSFNAYGIAEAGMDNSEAEYATSGVTLEADWKHWQLLAGRQHYQWNRPSTFPGMTGSGKPWENFSRLRLGFSHGHQLSDHWSIETLVGVQSDYEEELDKSWTTYLGGYGTYSADENWLWFLGLLYSRHAKIASDFEWIPILGAAWRPNATEGLSVRFGLPITHARWHFSSRTRLTLDLNTIEGGVYRLADDSSLQPEGYIEMMNASLSIHLETDLSDSMTASLGIGHSLHREWTLYSETGRKIDSADVDDAPSLQISLHKTF